MITRILRALHLRRRRASTHLTAKYEARCVARLRDCNQRFKQGRVGAHFNEGPSA